MKASGTTTQAEVAPGNAIQRHTSPNSSTSPTPRTASPHDEETSEHFNPPIYDRASIPPPGEKDGPIETQQSIRRHSSAILEAQPFPNTVYSRIPQPLPGNFNLSPEEPACDLLLDRPAVWIVKGKGVKLSCLSAAILLNDGIISSKDLTL